MINGANTKRLYESFCRGDSHCEGRSGPAGFVSLTRRLMGIEYDDQGRKQIGRRQMRPEELDMRDLAEALIGPDWYEQLAAPAAGETLLREDATAAVRPSAFNNISAWNTTVAGLLEAKILEGFRRPGFLADRLAASRPTRLRSDKLIGVANVGDAAETMKPGQRHPRAQFGERYVTTPETSKRGLAIDVTREAVFFDETRGQVLEQAESIGYTLGLRKERLVIDTFIGVDNTYSYKGSSANTYQSGGSWVNDQSNPLVDWQDVDESLQLFSEMTDPETGEPILAEPRDVLVMPAREMTARYVFSYETLERRSDSASEIGRVGNPLRSMGFQLLPASVLLYNRITAADGLNVAAADAKEYWFHGDFRRAFAYMENWSIDVRRAAPDSYTAADRDLVLSIFANEMGAPAVIEPRLVVRNKN